MNYAIAVGVCIAVYILGFVLPLFLGSGGSIIRLAIFSIPILLVGPRVAQRFTDKQPLLPKEVRSEGGLLYAGGIGLIWLGHLFFFGLMGAAVVFAGMPIGIFAGYAIFPYFVGVVLVELAYRQWSNRQAQQPWKSQQYSIYIIVGMIGAAHFVLNLTSDRPIDLLSFDERGALARGRGYAREVQRVADSFYVAEKRMPCRNDRYIDVGSLLHSTSRDMSKELSIDLLGCGRFVVTIHKPIDGVTDGKLLFVASPGDADAGTPLDWQCVSAHHERIERHTNGGCTYDPSLTTASLAPVGAPATGRTAAQSADPLVNSSPSIQDHLDRLAEPTLWENCNTDVTTYRFMRFDAGQYVAVVRISHDSQEGAYRSVSSSSPGKTIGSDGYVGERTWGRVEAGFDAADFWHLQSERNTSRPDESRIYLEACRSGTYHAVQRKSGDSDFASIARTFTTVGKLDWLEN